MANPLDLEEQEQLDQLKHFWKQYGNAITWSLIVVLGAFASWNFYNYWQRSQAIEAAVLYGEVERVSQLPNQPQLERAFLDMKERYPSSIYSQQAGLLVAKQNFETGNVDSAKSALTWVTQSSADTGFKSIARLRLAGVLSEMQDYTGAMKILQSSFPADFGALAADRRGDILMLQNKKPEALIEFKKAFNLFEERSDYRRLVEVKLNALGTDPMGTSFDSGDRV
jgi:predicted negative regulator of RcsB-dependent stress response